MAGFVRYMLVCFYLSSSSKSLLIFVIIIIGLLVYFFKEGIWHWRGGQNMDERTKRRKSCSIFCLLFPFINMHNACVITTFLSLSLVSIGYVRQVRHHHQALQFPILSHVMFLCND